MEERASSVRRTEAASVGRNDEPEAAAVRGPKARQMQEAAEPSANEGGGSGRMEERTSGVRRTEAARVGRNDEPEAAVVRRRRVWTEEERVSGVRRTEAAKRWEKRRTRSGRVVRGPKGAANAGNSRAVRGRRRRVRTEEERASGVRRTEAAKRWEKRRAGSGRAVRGRRRRVRTEEERASGTDCGSDRCADGQEEPRHAFDANFPQVQPKRREQREQNRPSARLKGRNWHTGARGGDSIGGCEGRQASQTSVCAAKVFAAGSVRANRRARRAAPLSARNRSVPRRAIGRREIRQAPATVPRREARQARQTSARNRFAP